MALEAILWDYDGTLADSTQKTMEVTLDVLSHFIPNIRENLPYPLQSKENFLEASGRISDWKELYRVYYKLNDEQLEKGCGMWGDAQLRNQTDPELFDRIPELLENFKDIKMGICTQNSRKPVIKNLEHLGVLKYFGAVIGVEEVAFDEQKPHPAAFINCLDALDVSDRNRTFAYIGDHSVDVAFGRNAEAMLKKGCPEAKVVCIAVHYPGSYSEEDKNCPPDYIARNSAELLRILNGI